MNDDFYISMPKIFFSFLYFFCPHHKDLIFRRPGVFTQLKMFFFTATIAVEVNILDDAGFIGKNEGFPTYFP